MPNDGGSVDTAGGDGGAADGAQPDGAVAPVDEQQLVYRVYAEFGDDRLPASYPRPTDENIDSTVMLEVARLFPTLSAETQAILDPFLRPPGDPDSWFAARLMGAAETAAFAPGETAAAPNPLCAGLLLYEVKTTAHTNIWYFPGDFVGEPAATALALEIETIYTAVTGLFDRHPPPDTNVTSKCNGGDGALDVYMVPFSGAKHFGRTIPYGSVCGDTPSYIELNAAKPPREILAAFAHELFHVLQLGRYNFAAACSDYDWLGEATGNWVIDHVLQDNQTEVPYAAGYMAVDRKEPIDEYKVSHDDNGYIDYVFFEYLTRKSSPATMRAIWDATEAGHSVAATADGMQMAGGAREVWARFALATWNDSMAGVQNDLFTGDPGTPPLDWGLKKMFDLRDAGGPHGDPSTPVKLEGASGKTFKLMQTAGELGVVGLPRLSVHADYLKFVDENVRSVMYTNISAAAPPNANLKIQALIKKGGSWGAPEDWTRLQAKAFCRDVTDERIEELVLIYSNSDTVRPSNHIVIDPPPLLSVSNVGCWRWHGTSRVEEQSMGPAGSSQIRAAGLNLTFERWRPPGLPTGATGKELFEVLSGTVEGSSTIVQGCTTTGTGGGPLMRGVASGSLDVWLGLDLGLGTPMRTVAATGSTSHPTHTEFSCPGAAPIPFDGDMSWSWLELPQLDEQKVEVRADGTIQGTYTRTFTVPQAGTRTMTWMLSPVRQ